MTREETAPGQVLCFGSDEDSGCDVGTSIGLGDGKLLWIGELLTRDGANMGFVFHGPDRERIVAPFADGTDWQEIAELFRHYVAPAIAKIVDTMCEQAESALTENLLAQSVRLKVFSVPGESPGQWRDRVRRAAIRALPATGEVGRG